MVNTMAKKITPQDKFFATRQELKESLIERDTEIDLVLTGLIAQEHVLLVGPPGTGKSMLSDAVTEWISGTKFTVLLNRFSTPEEVFGPISVQGLKNDKYKRIPDGKMPTADVAFVDEIFNASSAILNTMLHILNERKFVNDDIVVQCPLKLCVGASNQWPGGQDGGGQELGALFDRFLLRKTVRNVSAGRSLDKLLWAADLTPKLSTTITDVELVQSHQEAVALPWGQNAKDAFVEIVRKARQEGITPGDRRLRKSVKIVSSAAWLDGAVLVEPDHLEILSHVLWDDPTEQPKKIAEIVSLTAQPTGMQISALVSEAAQVIESCGDGKDLGKLSVAAKKLGEIQGNLKKIPGQKAKTALDKVSADFAAIKEATLATLKI